MSSTKRMSCNHESVFCRNSVCQVIIESDKAKSTQVKSSVTKGMLHGAIVDVFVGNTVHQCIIRSSIGGPRPFIAQSESSGIVRQRFTANTAKMLRQQGSVPNMTLV